jgi:hypothetical protein
MRRLQPLWLTPFRPIYGEPEYPMPETAAPRVMSWPLLAASALIALALAGTVVLWAYYGTTVFFETIRGGFVACFG